MLQLLVLLQLAALNLGTRLRDTTRDRWRQAKPTGRGERGSVTIEHVLWAVAVIAIVAIVVAAVKAYVTAQAGNIN